MEAEEISSCYMHKSRCYGVLGQSCCTQKLKYKGLVLDLTKLNDHPLFRS
jgi:hypothetical protein